MAFTTQIESKNSDAEIKHNKKTNQFIWHTYEKNKDRMKKKTTKKHDL